MPCFAASLGVCDLSAVELHLGIIVLPGVALSTRHIQTHLRTHGCCHAGDPNTLPFLMMVLIISKGVGDRFNYSVFHHQIMLKAFSFVGGIPEHLIKRAHLDVSVWLRQHTSSSHLKFSAYKKGNETPEKKGAPGSTL